MTGIPALAIHDTSGRDRLASIESYRVIAIILVVFLHTNVFARLQSEASLYGYVTDLSVYLVFWICLPFFFLVSGYFFGKRVSAGEDPSVLFWKWARPLLFIFLFWLAVYCLIPPNWIMVFREDGLGPTLTAQAAKSLGTLWAQHITLLLIPQPPIYHLWFLPALVMALALVRAVMVHGLERIVTGCMVGLYVISIATEVAETYVTVSYPPTMYALAMLFTLLGWWLSRQVLPSASMSLWLIAGGYLLAFAEAAILKIAFHASSHAIAFHSYAGAIVMVTGIFLFLLAKPTWGEQSILPRLARFTLGVYVSHILIHNALTPLYTSLPRRPAIWHLAYGCAVYGISVLFTVVFSHLPGLGWFVSRQNVGTHQIMNRLRDLRLKRSA